MIEFLPNLIPISVGAGCGFCLLGAWWWLYTNYAKKPKDEPKWERNEHYYQDW
jgi:hypothetical protein